MIVAFIAATTRMEPKCDHHILTSSDDKDEMIEFELKEKKVQCGFASP
jgi:hypothetical protein